MIKYIKSRLTMKNSGECLFVDKVNNKPVYLYVDCYGTEYMAQSKYGFRVKRNKPIYNTRGLILPEQKCRKVETNFDVKDEMKKTQTQKSVISNIYDADGIMSTIRVIQAKNGKIIIQSDNIIEIFINNKKIEIK